MLLICLAAVQKIDPPAPTTHFMHGSDVAPDPEGTDALQLTSMMPLCVTSSNLFLSNDVLDVKRWLM